MTGACVTGDPALGVPVLGVPVLGELAPCSAALRIVRAGVFGVAGTLLGVAAHRLGGGAAPPAWQAGLALAALFAMALVLTGRERGRGLVISLVLVSQTVIHVGFSLGAASGMSMRGQSLLGMVLCHQAGHPLTAQQVAAARATLAGLGVQTPSVTAPSPGLLCPAMAIMLAMHLLAASALAWWLARGERTVWRWGRRVVHTLRTVGARVGSVRPSVHAVVGCVPTPLLRRWWGRTAQGRAPPRMPRHLVFTAAA